MKNIFLILGTGLYELYLDGRLSEERTIETKYGQAEVFVSRKIGEGNIYVILRHGKKHSLPPHLINYRANIAAAKELKADAIVATASVGSITRSIPIGSYVVLSDFIDATKSRSFTFFTDATERFAHTDMTTPFSPIVRKALVHALRRNRVKRYRASGVYVCTEGPRFETPAEIRMYRKAGADVVGMTGVPEVVLASELGIPYGTLARVTNMAAGLQREISQEEVIQEMNLSLPQMKSILDDTLEELSKT